ncbi:hypothetical protein, partial [Klebsiella pneumoniae]|uniref:hypothetical protein n=1 Tax=Klebsiella pneumoniae TaxID=573 RepID=UPI00210A28CE
AAASDDVSDCLSYADISERVIAHVEVFIRQIFQTFRTVLAELGLELPGGNKPEPRDYAELLTSIADRLSIIDTSALISGSGPGTSICRFTSRVR